MRVDPAQWSTDVTTVPLKGAFIVVVLYVAFHGMI